MKLNKKGFTLVELMVVIVIIGILAAIIIPNVAKNIEKANQTKALSEGKSAYSELIGILDLGTYTMSEKFTYYDVAQKMEVTFTNGSANLDNLKTENVSIPTESDIKNLTGGNLGDTICINNEGVNTFYYYGTIGSTTGWHKWTAAEGDTAATWKVVTTPAT